MRTTAKVDYMAEFVKRYPELYKNHPWEYYAGKCGIVITLFIEMCINDFGMKSVERLKGTKKEWTRKFGPNACHIVVQINGVVYDPTYAQISHLRYPNQALVRYWQEPYSSWQDFYDNVEVDKWTLRKCAEYRQWWTEDALSGKPDIDQQYLTHYNQLKKVGYI